MLFVSVVIRRVPCDQVFVVTKRTMKTRPNGFIRAGTKYTTNYFNSERPSFKNLTYSVRKDLTGLAMAALIAWKLIVIIAITVAVVAATIKTHQLIVIL